MGIGDGVDSVRTKIDLRSPSRPLGVRDKTFLALWACCSLFAFIGLGWGWHGAKLRAAEAGKRIAEDRRAVEALELQIQALKDRVERLQSGDGFWVDGLAEVSHLLSPGTALHAYQADAGGEKLVLRTAGEQVAEEAFLAARWKPFIRDGGAEVTLWKSERDGE